VDSRTNKDLKVLPTKIGENFHENLRNVTVVNEFLFKHYNFSYFILCSQLAKFIAQFQCPSYLFATNAEFINSKMCIMLACTFDRVNEYRL
jgi:hypothetical protein